MNRYRLLEVCHTRLDQCMLPAEGKGIGGSQEGMRGLKRSEGVLIRLWQKRRDKPVQWFRWVAEQLLKVWMQGTSLVVQWLRPHVPKEGMPGSIPGQETRFCHNKRFRIPQRRLKIPYTTTKTQCSQINKNIQREKKKVRMWLEMVHLLWQNFTSCLTFPE